MLFVMLPLSRVGSLTGRLSHASALSRVGSLTRRLSHASALSRISALSRVGSGGPTAIDLTNPRRSRVPRRAARHARHRQARRRTSRPPRAPPRRPLWLAAANSARPSPRSPRPRAPRPRRRETTGRSASSLSTRKMARRQRLDQSQAHGAPRGSRRITRSGDRVPDRQMRPPDDATV